MRRPPTPAEETALPPRSARRPRPAGDRPRRVVLLLAWLGLAGGLWGCAARGGPASSRSVLPEGETRLPVRWVADYPLLETFVDGHGPYRFILDTGAGVTAISPAVQTASAELGGGLRIRDSSGRTREALGWREVDLAIGEARFVGVSAAVVDLAPLSAAIGHEIDGIAGFPLFRDALLTLDYRRSEVRVRHGRLEPPDGNDRLALHVDPLPEIDVELGERPERVLVDSGSLETLAFSEWPRHLSFRHGPIPIAASVSLHGGVRVEQVGRIATSLRIGRHEFAEPLVQSCGDGRRLGTGTLRHFVITFDSAGGVIELRRPAADLPIVMEPVVGTGIVHESRRGYWVVLEVVDGSPADRAGVRVGDRILQVDGMPVDRLASVSDWRWSNRFRFTIEREGRASDFHVGVDRLIP